MREHVLELRQRVRHTFKKAVLEGHITREDTCSECGSQDRVEAHHSDYTRPLEVVYLCRLCHARLHQREPKLPYGDDVALAAIAAELEAALAEPVVRLAMERIEGTGDVA